MKKRYVVLFGVLFVGLIGLMFLYPNWFALTLMPYFVFYGLCLL